MCDEINFDKYRVWPDSESRINIDIREFDTWEEADEYASGFVHKYDGEEFRVIAHIEYQDETINTYENINPWDGYFYEDFINSEEYLNSKK